MITNILSDIQAKKFSPIYYLHGEESYLIDKILTAIDTEGVVLQAHEVDFNRTVCYGPETNANQIVSACRSFPVMATHRLVIVKEAHRLNKKEAEKLGSYLAQPVPSTVLVMAFKGRNTGLGKAAVKKLAKGSVNFHAKKLYDRDVQNWIGILIQEKGFTADPGIPAVLTANLGLDLGLIENELDKMFIFLKASGKSHLEQNYVYEMINVDKEFNVFELVNALSKRDHYRSHMIIDRLTQNTKIHPPVLTVSGLFRFFHNLALVHRHQLRDPNSIKHQLGVNYYQAKDFSEASRRYNLALTYRNIGYIQECDLALKGMVPTQMNERHVLKTLVYRLLN